MRTSPQSSSSSQVRSSSYSRNDDFRIDNHNVHRVHPAERGFVTHKSFGHFYSNKPHYFGYRIERLPRRYVRKTFFGIDYYVCDDIYYRPYNGHYVVCRPPFGVVINTRCNRTFHSVRFAYYSNIYNTYRAIDANNRYIDQQNRIIAQNNAIIMSQNNYIATNPHAAQSSYDVANRLGLVQSYAYADRNYFYEDGIFYIINANGRYETIVPPAGALVDSLPEDYDTLTLGGVEYYRVDDTVYRMVLVSGVPYLEVLGQMYGSMSRQYNRYYDW